MSVQVDIPEVDVGNSLNGKTKLTHFENSNGYPDEADDDGAAEQSERLLDSQSTIKLTKTAPLYNQSSRFSVSTERITYGWNNICAWVGSGEPEEIDRRKVNEHAKVISKFTPWKSENKSILHNVSGVVYPGELVAILGASGAGKTTLLDILSFRNSSKVNTSGTRVINGAIADRNRITAVSAYVQQTDLFLGVLTVREHLVFQAMVRMHQRIPSAERMERVEQVIEEFGLSNCADTKIETRWFRGISGGEKKRLAIASEVLTDPMLMCCDEPTSGLDSTTAQNVISTLKHLASKGKTVICTIHQPSSLLFTMFDKVLLMAEGRIAFLGSTPEALKFFSNLGYDCPSMFNPADFFIDTLAIKNIHSHDEVKKICKAFDESSAGGEIRIACESNGKTNEKQLELHSKTRSPYKASWLKQFSAVLRRSWISYTRDPMILPMRLAQTVILSLFVGTIFYQLDLENYSGMQNLIGALFMLMACVSYSFIIGTLDFFCSELPIFLREHFNGMYRTDVYYISKILVEFPFFIILPAIVTGIAYFMIGLHPSTECFLKTLLIMVIFANVCSGVGYFISCVASSVAMALILVPLGIFPYFLFSGFILRPGTGPVLLAWIENISFYFYGFEALAIVQLEKIESLKCNFPNGTCPESGLAVLEYQGFNKDNFVHDAMMLGILAAGIQTLAFLVLLSRTYRQ